MALEDGRKEEKVIRKKMKESLFEVSMGHTKKREREDSMWGGRERAKVHIKKGGGQNVFGQYSRRQDTWWSIIGRREGRGGGGREREERKTEGGKGEEGQRTEGRKKGRR
jgi:hypothetical protein